MNTPILEIEHLTVEYQLSAGQLRAVDDVSFSINRGDIVGIVGESGSGKSTLALAIMDLVDVPGRITDGSVKYQGEMTLGKDTGFWRALRGRKIGMIFQSPQGSFNPCATIGRQLERVLCTHLPIGRFEARERIVNALERVKMPRPREVLNSYAFELSGGMCQRVALAAALSLEPGFLIADEPTSSLDLVTQVEITKLLTEIHHDSGISMLIISHDIGFVSRLVSHVGVMHRGRLVEYGDLDRILYAPQIPYTRALLDAIPKLKGMPHTGNLAGPDSTAYAGHSPAPSVN